MTEFERISRNMHTIAEGIVAAKTSLTPLGIASIFAGIGVSLMGEAIGRDGTVKWLRDMAEAIARGDDIQIERPN